MLANAGHFDVEIDLSALAGIADGPPEDVLPLVTQYALGDRRLNLLASGRVVNLAAGQGHPAAVMDMSFANQVLAVEHLVLDPGGRRGGQRTRPYTRSTGIRRTSRPS